MVYVHSVWKCQNGVEIFWNNVISLYMCLNTSMYKESASCQRKKLDYLPFFFKNIYRICLPFVCCEWSILLENPSSYILKTLVMDSDNNTSFLPSWLFKWVICVFALIELICFEKIDKHTKLLRNLYWKKQKLFLEYMLKYCPSKTCSGIIKIFK